MYHCKFRMSLYLLTHFQQMTVQEMWRFFLYCFVSSIINLTFPPKSPSSFFLLFSLRVWGRGRGEAVTSLLLSLCFRILFVYDEVCMCAQACLY